MIAQSRVAIEAMRTGLVEELAPSDLTGVENVGVVLEHTVREIGLAQVLPDILCRGEP
jgi:hypothetical protein